MTREVKMSYEKEEERKRKESEATQIIKRRQCASTLSLFCLLFPYQPNCLVATFICRLSLIAHFSFCTLG